MKVKNARGFSVVEILVSIFVIGTIAVAGLFVYTRNRHKDIHSTSPSSTNIKPANGFNAIQPPASTTTTEPVNSTPHSSQSPPPSTPSNSNSNTASYDDPKCALKPDTAFDIATFYNNVQNGMTYSQVCQQAGYRPGDCIQTDSYPANISCTWNKDSATYVTVSFGSNDSVKVKTKTGF